MKFYNPFKWHIVKNDNEQYAVRRWGFLGCDYVDLGDTDYTWSEGGRLFSHCLTSSKEKATRILKKVSRKHTWTKC